MIQAAKDRIRKEVLQRRQDLSVEKRAHETAQITEKFFKLPEYQHAKLIGFYASTVDEVLTDDLVEQALREGKRVVLPKVRITNYELRGEYSRTGFTSNVLDWYEIKSLNDLEIGAFKIREPREGLPRVELSAIDLLVVPGVAFDPAGNRIGYGKGFYDRVLGEFQGVSVALAFTGQLVEKIPTEVWDQRVGQVLISD